MYLLSIYFDYETDTKIRSYMRQIAKHTGNTAMIDGEIPPHITISEFNVASEQIAIELFDRIAGKISAGTLQWVSVGVFFPKVIYLMPLLNEYLHELSKKAYEEISSYEGAVLNPYYLPFHWVPHVSIGKGLEKEQMKRAFLIMQNQFGVFGSAVVKVGLARTKPYRNIAELKLK